MGPMAFYSRIQISTVSRDIMRSEYRLSRPWTTTEGFGGFFRGSLSDMLKAGLARHTVHFHEFHLRYKLYFLELLVIHGT